MKTRTQKIVMTSLIAAICCVATMIIKIPSPLNGYINLGDCVVLLSGWLLPPVYGFLGAGIGSALADIFSGYIIYAPATLVIKGLMAIVAFYGFKLIGTKMPKTASRVICGAAAEVIMLLGYYVFEGFMYGWGASLVNISANAIQGVVGLVLGVILIKVFEKTTL